MANVFFLQVLIYLFLAPLAMVAIFGAESRPFQVAIAFSVALAAGYLSSRRRRTRSFVGDARLIPRFKQPLRVGLMLLAGAYIYVVLANDLMFRRQGSDVMAAIHAALPLEQLAILRLFEVLLYPALLLCCLGLANPPRRLGDILLLVSLLTALLFSGVADSRAKIILPVAYAYVFLLSRGRWRSSRRSILILAVVAVVTLVLAAQTQMARLADYADVRELVQNDAVKRLDGLELLTDLRAAADLPLLGTWDWKLLTNLVAAIPLLEEAQALKALGLTSSKQYLLAVVLRSNQVDMNNSMVTDLFYLGGYLLLTVVAFVVGRMLARGDDSILSGRYLRSRTVFALTTAFAFAALKFEQDFFSMPISVLRDGALIYAMLLGVSFPRTSVPSAQPVVNGMRPQAVGGAAGFR